MRDRDKPKTLRCAIYTRKSSEEGLEQDFNSLHAQREACEAYIMSQRHEGWKALTTLYDDGGHSGGTMERPALKQLLADIQAKRVDIVVVYKVDRLTRSLTDFAKIVEVFDAQGVSFVSVTQQFNTTSSMGRLTLNVLLSFAQFEREVTGERIRDKIAASKKKGMWMGGVVPLGYDAKDRSLVINERDAETVREIFRLYLELGSVLRLEDELSRRGIRTKRYTTTAGRVIGDQPFSRGHLYKLLSNPVYLGEIQHRKVRHPGLHPAIIDRKVWDPVQATLSANANIRANGTSFKYPSLLAGLLFDDVGNRFVATHATKNGKRYRYYVRELRAGASDSSVAEKTSFAAEDLETQVAECLARFLRDDRRLVEGLQLQQVSPGEMEKVLSSANGLAMKVVASVADDRRETIATLVQRITINRSRLRINLQKRTFLGSVAAQDGGEEGLIIEGDLSTFEHNNGETLLIETHAEDASRAASIPNLRDIARGYVWFEQLTTGRSHSIEEIARREGITDRYVSEMITAFCNNWCSVSPNARAT